jgi:Flp pilus assembly protein TadB
MPLSPQEERALAALEEELADDPALVAVLAGTPSARPSYLPSTRTTLHVVSLLAALGALIAVGTLVGDRPMVLAVVAAALLVPWLVWVAGSRRR